MTAQPSGTNRTTAQEQIREEAFFAEIYTDPIVQAVYDLRIVDDNNQEPPGVGKASAPVATALQHTLHIGATLVEQSTIGGFFGIINGQLILKLQLRLPIKKTMLFLGSLLTLAGLLAPYLAHIQVIWH